MFKEGNYRLTGIFFVAVFCLIIFGWPTISRAAAPSWCPNCTFWAYEYTGDSVLTKDKSPYYIDRSATIVGKVVIEPGVVIKVGPAYQSGWYLWAIDLTISGNGSLEVNGTATEPVVFTTYTDDNYGGDSNLDGVSTTPSLAAWGGFIFNTATPSSFNHVKIFYSGGGTRPYTVIENLVNGSFTNSEIAYSYGDGLLFRDLAPRGGQLLIDSNIFRNSVGGINYQNTTTLQITNNHFLDNNYGLNILRTSQSPYITIKNNLFKNNAKSGLATVLQDSGQLVDATENDWGDLTGPHNTSTNPLGRGDKIGDYALFDPWLGKVIKPDPVILIPGIMGSWPVKGEWRLDPIFGTYDNLWSAFKQAGYYESQDLFSFPYQWRTSNVLTAELLKQKISEVKQICNCQKIDLVAHSMGGLVARQYIEGDDYANDVDQMIFLGTPHQGATKSYLTWEGGEFGPGIDDKFMKSVFRLEAIKNGYLDLSKYTKSMIPTTGQLLPIYDYLRDKDSGILRSYPTAPYNDFLNLLNQNTQAQKLFDRVRVSNIVGDLGSASTYDKLRVIPSVNNSWPDGYPESFYIGGSDHGIEYGNGDGTVPLRSSTVIGDRQFTSNVLAAQHSDLVTSSQRQVIKILTGKDPAGYIDHGKIYNALFITVHSPIDLLITSPNGQTLGYDQVNNTTTQEIIGAFYDPDLEFAIIPNPEVGEYKIKAQGTGVGGYQLEVNYLADDFEATQTFNASTSPQVLHEFIFDYVSSTEPLIKLEPVDKIAPEVIVAWPQEKRYLNSGDVTISFEATDNLAGIATTTATLDGQPAANGQKIDLALLAVGKHALKIKAEDLAGNSKIKEVNFSLITTWPVFLKNLQYYYSLGMFKNRGNFVSLMLKLNYPKKLPMIFKELKTQWRKQLPEKVFQLIFAQINYLINK